MSEPVGAGLAHGTLLQNLAGARGQRERRSRPVDGIPISAGDHGSVELERGEGAGIVGGAWLQVEPALAHDVLQDGVGLHQIHPSRGIEELVRFGGAWIPAAVLRLEPQQCGGRILRAEQPTPEHAQQRPDRGERQHQPLAASDGAEIALPIAVDPPPSRSPRRRSAWHRAIRRRGRRRPQTHHLHRGVRHRRRLRPLSCHARLACTLDAKDAASWIPRRDAPGETSSSDTELGSRSRAS